MGSVFSLARRASYGSALALVLRRAVFSPSVPRAQFEQIAGHAVAERAEKHRHEGT